MLMISYNSICHNRFGVNFYWLDIKFLKKKDYRLVVFLKYHSHLIKHYSLVLLVALQIGDVKCDYIASIITTDEKSKPTNKIGLLIFIYCGLFVLILVVFV